MKTVEQMTRTELERLAQVVQDALYLVDYDGQWVYDPAKEWDCETLDSIAEALDVAGLVPVVETARPMLVDGKIRSNPPMAQSPRP